jgi:hypothetical protein
VNFYWGTLRAPVLSMSDNGALGFYDKAERDRQHAFRRIQRRRARSIVSWAVIPWVIAAAVIAVVFCL